MAEPIFVVDYDPAWPDTFEALRARLLPAVSDLGAQIEHVGSTAVPGMAAKPIVDLDIVLRASDDLPEVIERLAALGYMHQGDLGVAGREAFQSPPGTPAHHLYVCTHGSEALENHLVFRDYLRGHPDEAARYGALKKELAIRFCDDRAGYTEAKHSTIRGMLQLAFARKPYDAAG